MIATKFGAIPQVLLLIGEVAVPASNNVPIHLSVLQVAPLKCIDLPLQVYQSFLPEERK